MYITLGVDGDTSDGHTTGDGLGHGECGVVTDEELTKGVASGLVSSFQM
jgi:hypothetical protein